MFIRPEWLWENDVASHFSGLEEPTTGSIAVNGKDITALPPGKRNFGMVFQSYALFPNLTALENIEYGLKTKIWESRSERESARCVKTCRFAECKR